VIVITGGWKSRVIWTVLVADPAEFVQVTTIELGPSLSGIVDPDGIEHTGVSPLPGLTV
jgi:hypothetical protein